MASLARYRVFLASLFAGGLALGLVALSCDGTSDPPTPFPIPDAGPIGSPGPGDAGIPPDDAYPEDPDGPYATPADAGTAPGDV